MDRNYLLVYDAMSKNIVTAKSGDFVLEIAKSMRDKDIGSVVIVNDDNIPIGIVTEGDIVRKLVATGKDGKDATAGEVMTAPVITITDDIELSAAARLMSSNRIKKLCIVNLDGTLKGILSESDIVKHSSSLVKLFQ